MNIFVFNEKLFTLLYNNLCYRGLPLEYRKEINDYFSLEENKNMLSLIFRSYIEFYLQDIFSIEQFIDERRDSSIFLKISLKKKYLDLNIEEQYYDLKSWNPMVVEPKDWILKIEKKKNEILDYDYNYGGYLNNGKRFFIDLCKNNSYSNFKFLTQEALNSINYLQKQRMKVNRKLLNFLVLNKAEIKKRLYEYSEEYLEKKLKELREQANLSKLTLKDFDEEAKKKWWREYYSKKQFLTSKLSKINSFEYVLKTAKEYANYDYFYFMFESDVRGRLYPKSSSLNYQGEPLAKALIHFYEESKFDLDWFKIYCVRLYGAELSMKSLVNMLEYFDKDLSVLMKDYKQNNIWLKAEEPFIFLSCCLEYERYLLFKEDYKTGFPIYFDATCSALQLISLLFNLDEYKNDLNLSNKKFQKKLVIFI